ncbi:hypothetical protein PENTCL1PPCAC_26024 [Pristionchus entomophagus]|uniref:Uncharacterized protein n=1 Tax=Pristionchus entomophagus TaxID=358040 RepID=A0AAV5UBZ6_9BILA|nr:hypothetical protein PENTCL1PPCAC_26024 [Pristionchus entomophagus]
METRSPSPTESASSGRNSPEAVEEEENEESGQSWLYSHLSTFPIEDQAITALLEGDLSLFIRFHALTNDADRILYVVVRKRKIVVDEASLLPSIEPERPKEIKPAKVKRVMRADVSPSKKKSSPHREGRLERRKNRDKSNGKKKGKSSSPPKKREGQSMPRGRFLHHQAIQREERKKELENELAGGGLPTYLEFVDEKEIPDTQQFVVIIPRETRLETEKNEFDQLYAIAFVRNRANLDTSIHVASLLLDDSLTWEGHIDLLMINACLSERRLNKFLLLERFILDTIGTHFCVDGRKRVETASDEAKSMHLLLVPPITAFAQSPSPDSVARLQLQCAFFDLQFVGDEEDMERAAHRLERALTQIFLLFSLFKDEASDWSRRLFLYVLDLFSTILASYIMKKSALITNPEGLDGQICHTFEKFVKRARELSGEIFDNAEDRANSEKLVFSFSIVEILEEEIDALLELVRSLNDERRDMAMHRAPLDECEAVLKEVVSYLDENCLASVVESGSLEALRSIVQAVVAYTKKLEKLLPPIHDPNE